MLHLSTEKMTLSAGTITDQFPYYQTLAKSWKNAYSSFLKTITTFMSLNLAFEIKPLQTMLSIILQKRSEKHLIKDYLQVASTLTYKNIWHSESSNLTWETQLLRYKRNSKWLAKKFFDRQKTIHYNKCSKFRKFTFNTWSTSRICIGTTFIPNLYYWFT